MRVAVKDANILIDLIEADMLPLWFRLGIETHTTDLVRYEVQEPTQRRILDNFVNAGLLRVVELSPEELSSVQGVSVRLRVSLADASALALAKRLGAALLSGDQALRKAAAAEKIEVRGVLWVLDRLVERRLLVPGAAATHLRTLMDGGSFLPAGECNERLRRWEAKGRP